MKKLSLLAMTVLLFAAAVSAQTSDTEVLQTQVDSLQRRLERVEKRAATWEKVKKHFHVSGFIQGGYNWVESTSSSFYLKRARVTLAGDIFRNKADYRLQVEFAGSPRIVDLFVRYRPFNELGIQLGQFKIPLSMENSEWSPLRLEFIEYSLVVQSLVRVSGRDVSLGRSMTGRDLGVQLYGGFADRGGYNLITYHLALFNGNGINLADDNKGKDFVGRIMVNPLKELTLAGYYQYGEGVYPQFGSSGYVRLDRYGGGVAYDGRDFFVRSEYIAGSTGGIFSQGAYLAAGYKMPDKFAASARFDYFDRVRGDADGWEYNYTLGLSYTPWRYLRLQLDYTLQHFRRPAAADTLFNGVNFMVTASF